MKIIILSILFTISKEQFIDEQSTVFESSTITQGIDSSNSAMYTGETKFSSMFDLFTIQNEILSEKEEWFNVNQTKSLIFWKKIHDQSTYILKSEGQCTHQMCLIKLKYNGTISKRKDGCLSFILWTNGQPMGQLWIEEDEEQESFSQKIQLTNSSLRVEHSLRSNIKNLSINARILFRNPKFDTITLSNLNLNWNGFCPIHSSNIITSFPEILTDQSTLSMELTTENSSEFIESTTATRKVKSSSYINESNILGILSLIISFCLLIIFASITYGIWTIQSHYRFTWYLPYQYPIQFLFRRSIRSSTRSNNRILTLSQMLSEDSISTIDSRTQSTITLSHTYF